MFDQNTNTNENIFQTGVFHMTNKKTNKIFTYEIFNNASSIKKAIKLCSFSKFYQKKYH